MEEKNNYLSFLCEKSKSQSSQVQYSREDWKKSLSFSAMLEVVKQQVEFECFDSTVIEQAEEIAMMIAEVYKLPGNVNIRIAGNDLPAELVAEVYEKIGHEHILHVIGNYGKATYEIKHTKTYLRTALYNAVFELTGRIDNEVYTDMPWLAKK